MITDNTKTLYNALEKIRDLTAERDKYRDACERLIGHYGSWELWGEAWSEDGKQSGFADKYLGFEIESDGDNGYDLARQVKAELEGTEGSEIVVE